MRIGALWVLEVRWWTSVLPLRSLHARRLCRSLRRHPVDLWGGTSIFQRCGSRLLLVMRRGGIWQHRRQLCNRRFENSRRVEHRTKVWDLVGEMRIPYLDPRSDELSRTCFGCHYYPLMVSLLLRVVTRRKVMRQKLKSPPF